MKSTLFISDLHLCAEQPPTTRLFLEFLQNTAPQAEALYILGDLFEYWAGDDDLDAAFNAAIVAALRQLSARGVKLYLMHGNRDFFMGQALAAACGGALLSDPAQLDLYGTPTLLMHGDTLCTADAEYQAFRLQVRDPAWQKKFLARPLAERKAEIETLRAQSEQQKPAKPMAIMDVTPQAVETALREHGYPRLIHGHTHRPGHHRHRVDGHTCERWVLSDWDKNRGGYLRCDTRGCELITL